MARKYWRLSAWAWALVLAAAWTSAGGRAQAGWSGNPSGEVPAAKQTPPPPPLQISGSWTGPIQDSEKGPGTIYMTFTETHSKTKAALKGTWLTQFPDTAFRGALNDLGQLKGSVIGNVVSVTLLPRTGDALSPCNLVFTSSPATQQEITGTFQLIDGCNNTGTITLQPGPTPTQVVFINIGDDFFFPTQVTIKAGQTVRWTNNQFEQHSVNANPGSAGCKP